MICDICLNWMTCRNLELEERPIMELEDGDIWCGNSLPMHKLKEAWKFEYQLLKDNLIAEFLQDLHKPLESGSQDLLIKKWEGR